MKKLFCLLACLCGMSVEASVSKSLLTVQVLGNKNFNDTYKGNGFFPVELTGDFIIYGACPVSPVNKKTCACPVSPITPPNKKTCDFDIYDCPTPDLGTPKSKK